MLLFLPILSFFLTFLCLIQQIRPHPTGDFHEWQSQNEHDADISKRQNIDQYYTYTVDSNAATQAANVAAKQAAGYRIISLSVYGDPHNPLYSTVWSNRPTSPTYTTLFTNNTEQFTNTVNSDIANGWTATLVSATGPAYTPPQLAIVLEKRPDIAVTKVQYDMTDGDGNTVGSFVWWNNQYYGQGLQLVSMDIYGGPNTRRWVAIWQSNPTQVETRYYFEDARTDYPNTVTTETLHPGFRPVSVGLDTDQTYSSLWANSRLASSVQYQHQYGLTHTALIQAIQTASSSGLAPISIAGGGSSTNTNIVYTLTLAPTDVVDTRVMNAPVGSINSPYFTNPNAAAQAIHDQIQGYMLRYNVRYAQISIKKNGQPRMDWAYAYTEPHNCVPFKCSVSPSDTFLLASNSKLFLAAAVNLLLQRRELTLNTNIFSLLGYVPNQGRPFPANAVIDNRYMQITVQQALNHQGGWNSSHYDYDPVFDMRNIAGRENTGGKPITTLQLVNFMAQNIPLDFDPGSGTQYSNFGYVVLSATVAAVTGVTYQQFLHNQILAHSGLNLAEVLEWQTAEANRPAGEITQESIYTGLSALNPGSTVQVPAVYGGDGMIKEVATGATDVASSMDFLSGFISKNAAWGWGPRTVSSREGSTFGAWTWAESRSDGIDWALAFNTRDWFYAEYTDGTGANNPTPEHLAGELDIAIGDLEMN